MGLKRRNFLQQAGLFWLSLGVGETFLSVQPQNSWGSPLVNRYLQTLAESTTRKLALLIGINHYSSQSNHLHGCLTDVELQKELLIYRFGFNSQDVMTLTGEKATKENIEAAFLEHLTNQAASDDVVVFHFSGYGNQVKMPLNNANDALLVNSLLTSNGQQNLLEESLFLLGRSVATDKLTMVLDTSYKSTNQVLQGNLRVRSLNAIAQELNPDVLAAQEQLKEQIKLKREKPGIILSAAKDSQIAVEGIWHGFSAGLFTYALTQYLWQVTPASTIILSIKRTGEEIESVMGGKQQPQLMGKPQQPRLTYYLQPYSNIGAEGIVTGMTSNGLIDLELVGLPAIVLDNYSVNSCLNLVPLDKDSSQTNYLQIRSRDGWKAKAKLIQKTPNVFYTPEIGQLGQEYIRVLPHNLGLIVALAPELERIERVDATSAFSNVPAVSSVVIVGEQSADCIFGRTKENSIEEIDLSFEPNSIILGNYCLGSISGIPYPHTIGNSNEAIKSAVARITPQLSTLLANKLLRLTINEGSSYLKVQASLELVTKTDGDTITTQTVMKRASLRNSQQLTIDQQQLDSNSFSVKEQLPRLTTGSQVQYNIFNDSKYPIYWLLLGVNSRGKTIALYCPELNIESIDVENIEKKNNLIAVGERVIIPNPSESLHWIINDPMGLTEIYLIFSKAPFNKTLEILSGIQYESKKQEMVTLSSPLKVAQALLEDLHTGSNVDSSLINSDTDVYALDVNSWTTLNFVYQVTSS